MIDINFLVFQLKIKMKKKKCISRSIPCFASLIKMQNLLNKIRGNGKNKMEFPLE